MTRTIQQIVADEVDARLAERLEAISSELMAQGTKQTSLGVVLDQIQATLLQDLQPLGVLPAKVSLLVDSLEAVVLGMNTLNDAFNELAEKVGAQPVPELPNEPEPEPEPEPMPELPVDELFNFDNVTGGEWERGISVSSKRFLLLSNERTREAFKVGTYIMFADAVLRTVTATTVAYGKLYVHYSGERVGPSMGAPYKVGVIYPEPVEPEEPEEPEPEEPTDPEEPEQPEEPTDPEEPEEPNPIDPTPAPQARGVMGIHLGMGGGHPQVVPGEIRYHYELPSEADMDRAISYGLKRFRINSLRERLIRPGGNSELYLGTHTSIFGGQKPHALPEIAKCCKAAGQRGVGVMLDLFHNYGGFSEGDNAKKDSNPQHKKIGSVGGPTWDTFANDWYAIISYLKQDPEVWAGIYGFDIMNEWVDLPDADVFGATQRFLDVCAPIMEDKMAIIEGNKYSNTPNFWKINDEFVNLVDPRGPGFIEMSGHLYSDQDMSGMYYGEDAYHEHERIEPEGVFYTRVKPFLDGCEQHGFKASIGEWIVPGDYPMLLADAEVGIAYALSRGCSVMVFGMGRGFNKTWSTHHNLEIERNIPTLEAVKRLAAL